MTAEQRGGASWGGGESGVMGERASGEMTAHGHWVRRERACGPADELPWHLYNTVTILTSCAFASAHHCGTQ